MRASRDAPSPDIPTRLIEATGELAGERGLAGVTVETVLKAAGVSRTSFYTHFSGLEDCLWQAYRYYADRLAEEVKGATTVAEHPEQACVDALVATAREHRAVAQLLMREGLAGGRKSQEERQRLIRMLAEAMGHAYAFDLPAELMLGGIFRFLSARLHAGEPVDCLAGAVQEWTGTFAAPPHARRWSPHFEPRLPAPTSAWLTVALTRSGAPRERMIRAAAAEIGDKGYRQVTVEQIAHAASVSRRAFYKTFPTKEDAFIAAYESGFQQTIAAVTPAFFSSGTWPGRVWAGATAFSRFMSEEPLFAYIGFVECYAPGPDFVARVHDTQLAFTLFLEDGYRQRPEARLLSRACSALTAAVVFELGFQAARRGPGLYRQTQPLAAFMALAPFIGRDAAGEFVLAKLTAHERPRGAREGRSLPAEPCAPGSST